MQARIGSTATAPLLLLLLPQWKQSEQARSPTTREQVAEQC